MEPLPAHLDAAYLWLCQQRWHFPAGADVWQWPAERERLREEMTRGTRRRTPQTAGLCNEVVRSRNNRF
jgi:hypothetical protein